MAAGKYKVKTEFTAKDKLTPSVNKMNASVTSFSRNAQKQFSAMSKRGNFFAKSMKTVAQGFGIGSGIMLFQQFTRVVKDSVSLAVDYEHTLITAAAKFPSMIRKGTDAYKELEKVTMQIGENTVFTASQAAKGLEFFAMAAFTAKQAMAMLPQIVNLAIASNTEFTRAADIATDVLGQFNLMSKDPVKLTKNLSRVVDVLAKSANSANMSVEQLFETFVHSAPVANSLGADVETVAALTGAIAGAGIKGSIAGTTLKNIYNKIANPSEEAQKMLEHLGVKRFDPDGNVRDMLDILVDLQVALKEYGTGVKGGVITEVFQVRALAGVSKILTDTTMDLKEYRASLKDSGGIGKIITDMIQESMHSQLLLFKSARESLVISLYKVGEVQFRSLIENLTTATRKMSKWVQENQPFLTEQLDKIVNFGKELVKSFDIDSVKNFFTESKEGTFEFIDALETISETLEIIGDLILSITKNLKTIGKVIKFTSAPLWIPAKLQSKIVSKATPPDLDTKLIDFITGAPSMSNYSKDISNFKKQRSDKQDSMRRDNSLNINFNNKPDEVDIVSDILDPYIVLNGGATR